MYEIISMQILSQVRLQIINNKLYLTTLGFFIFQAVNLKKFFLISQNWH